MAPARKRKSDEMAEPTTPEASNTPAPKRMRITQTQKQALIDNLQLEITERARQLRAQYALQCADLRSRIERRIHRVPMSMRSMTMQELMEKHDSKPAPQPKQEFVKPVVMARPNAAIRAPARATRKKKSSIVIATDPPQEVENLSNDDHLPNAQPAVATAPKSNPKGAKRPGSRTGRGAGGVLSPRSHNSRTLPRSPIKGAATSSADCQPTAPAPASPSKPHITRPFSPLKPVSPLKSAALATTSAISSSVHTMLSTAKSTATRSGKASTATVASLRSQVQPTRAVSQASNHSVTTNGTTTSSGTVVKTNNTRSVRGRTAAATAKKTTTTRTTTTTAAPKTKAGTTTRKAVTATAAANKKTTAATAAAAAAATAETASTTTTGRRVLRKRNPA